MIGCAIKGVAIVHTILYIVEMVRLILHHCPDSDIDIWYSTICFKLSFSMVYIVVHYPVCHQNCKNWLIFPFDSHVFSGSGMYFEEFLTCKYWRGMQLTLYFSYNCHLSQNLNGFNLELNYSTQKIFFEVIDFMRSPAVY